MKKTCYADVTLPSGDFWKVVHSDELWKVCCKNYYVCSFNVGERAYKVLWGLVKVK